MPFNAHPKRVSHSRTVAAAGDYAANDILSNSATNNEGTAWQWAVMPKPGHAAHVTFAAIKATAQAMVARTRLHLFSSNPSNSELDDNAALSIVAADRTAYLGYIDLPAMIDIGTLAYAQNDQLNFAVVSDDDTLYGILQTLDAETNEAAAMTVELVLQVD